MKEYKVMASSMIATYRAGKYVAGNKAEAIQMAKEKYRNSIIGRELRDVSAFRFYIVDDWTD